jgi:carbonic anhydrase
MVSEESFMNSFVEGYLRFRKEVYPLQAARHRSLAKGQTPHTLFITCSDSRVMPGEFTQTEQGELFQCRVVGNIVPAHGSLSGGVISAIEYSVMVLGVKDIVVCGHSDCGAMRAFSHPEKLIELKAVRSWIEHADSAITMAREHHGDLEGDEFLAALTKENVVSQLQHLRTHPCVATRLRKGSLKLHGWYYDIGEGTVDRYCEMQKAFVPLEQRAPTMALAY